MDVYGVGGPDRQRQCLHRRQSVGAGRHAGRLHPGIRADKPVVYPGCRDLYVELFRGANANFQASSQTIEVKLDNEVIGMFTPGGIAYTTEKTSSFTVASSGSHTLTFVGLDPNGGDNTAFIDQVLIATA